MFKQPRLLRTDTPKSSQRVAKFLRKVGVTQEAYKESLGCKTNHALTCLLDMNTEMTMRDLSAYIVENQERMR